MKGKRKPNGHQEKRGKQSFRRTIKERDQEHPNYAKEFGHLKGDTIVGHQHKSAVITLVERARKYIIAIKQKTYLSLLCLIVERNFQTGRA